VVILFDIAWLAVGSVWLGHYYTTAPIDDPKKVYIGEFNL